LPDAEQGAGRLDVLCRVRLRADGGERLLHIHFEVQAQRQEFFARRMFRYYYRLYDRYGETLVSIGILVDDTPNWRPDRYELAFFGIQLSFVFPVLKLTDWAGRIDELESADDPVALMMAAQLSPPQESARTDSTPQGAETLGAALRVS